ncbi:MAG: YlxR family protein [Acutalibacteraceae bacterium]|nr:YlxR family protein [Clostridia bacterium]MEE3449938.1 YlxR family protein [Acutalibacteraceae bacterium]
MVKKKIPMRKCLGCGEMKPKKELIRIVKAPQAKDDNGTASENTDISVDFTGKKPGRGAYICRNAGCLGLAAKAHRLERAFSCKIPEDVYEKLAKELNENG